MRNAAKRAGLWPALWDKSMDLLGEFRMMWRFLPSTFCAIASAISSQLNERVQGVWSLDPQQGRLPVVVRKSSILRQGPEQKKIWWTFTKDFVSLRRHCGV